MIILIKYIIYKISLFEMDWFSPKKFSKKEKFNGNISKHQRDCLLARGSWTYDAFDEFDYDACHDDVTQDLEADDYERYERNGRMKKRESKLFWTYVNSTNDSYKHGEKKDRVFLKEHHRNCKFCGIIRDIKKKKQIERSKNLEKTEGKKIKEFNKEEYCFKEEEDDFEYHSDINQRLLDIYLNEDYYDFCFHIEK